MNELALERLLREELRRIPVPPDATAPSIDLAVIVFPASSPPIAANVLLSRELPEAHVARFEPGFGRVSNVRYVADIQDATHDSIAWEDGADWQALQFRPLAGTRGPRFVSPYPASLIKLMVAIGVGRLVDTGAASWNEPVTHLGETRRVAEWADAMITVSSNAATEALVWLMHSRDLLSPRHNALNDLFDRLGLGTLRFDGTIASGGWRNADGAGVGQLQMTAWDTVRLLWSLRDDLGAPPWLSGDEPGPLSAESSRLLWHWLQDQALHEVLSTTLQADLPGVSSGIPARLPARWLTADGRAAVGSLTTGMGIASMSARADATFAHKTGTTDHYASDAGFVQGDDGRRYLIAVISTLGRRFAPHPRLATNSVLPKLGAAIDRWIKGQD